MNVLLDLVDEREDRGHDLRALLQLRQHLHRVSDASTLAQVT